MCVNTRPHARTSMLYKYNIICVCVYRPVCVAQTSINEWNIGPFLIHIVIIIIIMMTRKSSDLNAISRPKEQSPKFPFKQSNDYWLWLIMWPVALNLTCTNYIQRVLFCFFSCSILIHHFRFIFNIFIFATTCLIISFSFWFRLFWLFFFYFGLISNQMYSDFNYLWIHANDSM